MGKAINMGMIDVLTTEVCMLNDLIAGEQDDAVVEELKQERMKLVAKVNNELGTEHIMRRSTISTINNDFNND